jgi:hypothetical protein
VAKFPIVYCPEHGDRLICPTHEGQKGGRKTARLYPGKAKVWGKKGGRPKKKAGAKKKRR